MNSSIRCLTAGLAALCLGLAPLAQADSSAEEFVNEASAQGVAEVHNATVAVTKDKSQEVQNFAQQMLDDHSAANTELARIAARKNLNLADNANLLDRAKSKVLQLRSGESFDQAYANNQVVAHEQAVALYEEAATSLEDADLKAFAEQQLPALREHLEEARRLAAALGGSSVDADDANIAQ